MAKLKSGHSQPKTNEKLIPPGAMIQATRSEAFGPIEGKAWETAVRQLADPRDCHALAGALARHMGPGNIHDFLNFGLDLAQAPKAGPRVSAVMAQFVADETSTSVEIGSAANWCQNQYVAANLQSVAWADRVLECAPGEGAALAAAERELVLSVIRFKGEMQRVYGVTGNSLLAAVVGRLLGNAPDVTTMFLASMEWSRRVVAQLAKGEA